MLVKDTMNAQILQTKSMKPIERVQFEFDAQRSGTTQDPRLIMTLVGVEYRKDEAMRELADKVMVML